MVSEGRWPVAQWLQRPARSRRVVGRGTQIFSELMLFLHLKLI